MSVWEAIVLGVVQGITEFLPVSSSGHLQIAKEVLGVTLADNLTFDLMLHLATVMATIVALWGEVKKLILETLKGQAGYALKLLVSAVPIGIVGLVFRDQLNTMLASPAILLIVGIMLMVTAALLIFAGRAKERAKTEISWWDALIIGVAQAFAAMPGLSRSGTTIATGLMLGNKKAVAAQFSFLMIIIPILGEAVLDIGGARLELSTAMLVGFVAAFVVGVVACKFMIEMVKRSKLSWFAAYCAVVGMATIIYYVAA